MMTATYFLIAERTFCLKMAMLINIYDVISQYDTIFFKNSPIMLVLASILAGAMNEI